MNNIINFVIFDRPKNSPVKILNIYGYDQELIKTNLYFGDDFEEDLKRIKKEYGDEYHYVMTEGVYV